jgi:hypothetical protein
MGLNSNLVMVLSFNNLEKYEFVNGKDIIPYMKWKIKAMFETTNQKQFINTHFSVCIQCQQTMESDEIFPISVVPFQLTPSIIWNGQSIDFHRLEIIKSYKIMISSDYLLLISVAKPSKFEGFQTPMV